MLRLAVILIPLCLLACSDADCGRSGTIFPEGLELKAGDVVFRRGTGFTSQAVIMAEGGGAYSHTGIVIDSAGRPMIVHAVPGEPDYKGDEDRVKMDTPTDFFAKDRAQTGAVYRHQDSLTARCAAERALQTYRRHPLFDHDYDDGDTTRLYCTELVVHAYRTAGCPLRGVGRQHLHLVGFEADCVLPSDIQKSVDLQLMTTF